MPHTRFDNALFINLGGACNPSGIAHAIVDACREVRAEPTFTGTDELRKDPAIRLMLHHLCYLYGMELAEYDWNADIDTCKVKAGIGTLTLLSQQ